MTDSADTAEGVQPDNELGIFIPITFNLTGENEGRTLDVTMPLGLLWTMSRAAHASGMGAIMDVVRGTIILAHEAEAQNIPNTTEAVIAAWSQIIKIFASDPQKQERAWREETPKEDEVLRFTYGLLRKKAIPHKLAALIASWILGQESITENAWRKKVDRWADRNNLPAVGIYKRGRSEK